MPTSRVAAQVLPVARVLPLLGLAHLDRDFDYLVPEEFSETAQPGVRVRIRFSGRLVDAIVLTRLANSDHDGKLAWLDRVISPEIVFPPQTAVLVDALSARYAGIRSDIIRAAIPSRHAQAEEADTTTCWEELGKACEPDLSEWARYQHGSSLVDAVLAGNTARAVWQVAPGTKWERAVAALLAKVAFDGRGALLVLPNQRDVKRMETFLREWVSAKQITVLEASAGPQARYRRFLSVLHGQGRLVIGTRSAAFAPIPDLALAIIMHDQDDNLVDPRAPYVHAREVLTTRSAQTGCSLIIGGFSRSAESQLLVESGWAHDLVASREALRRTMPLIRGIADSDFELERDPMAPAVRIPKLAFEAARRSLSRGLPVLVQTPRKGYVPTLACGNCRAPARCRACNGPLGLPTSTGDEAGVVTCRWCGRPEPAFRCQECGSPKLRAVVFGAERTAEELGRAFPSVKVITSGGNRVLDSVDSRPELVIATPGAEPHVTDGWYGAALLLDSWALLSRPDLRASEETLAKWSAACALVAPASEFGEVVVVADARMPIVQNLIRWDVVAAAKQELEQRREVRFPPTVHMAVIDGPMNTVDAFLETLDLPASTEVLGPVDLPPGVSLPGDVDEARFGPVQRYLLRAPLGPRSALGRALRAGLIARAAVKDSVPLRVQVDPIHVG